jgi:hypothetical protein
MSGEKSQIMVHVKYGEVEKTLTGSPEDVWLFLNKFFSEFLPSFETAKKLILKIDLQSLIADCENIMAFSKEGSCLLLPKEKITDHETLLLWLLAQYIGFQLGLTESESVSKEELQAKLGKNAKITSTRLGELVKEGLASKKADGTYKITGFGLMQMQREIIPKIKSKIGN